MTDRLGIADLRGSTDTEAELASNCQTAIALVGKPSPLHSELVQAFALEGQTIARMLEGINPTRIEVTLNGTVVPYQYWPLVKPKAGSTVLVRAYPSGDDQGTKTVLGIVAMIAISVLSYGFFSGFFMGQTLWSFLAGTAVSVLGSLAVNALIRPHAEEKKQDQFYRITGASNQINPYGAVPIVIGEHVFFPPLAVQPYQHMMGQDQYVYVVYDCGPGDIQIDQLKFGSTDIADILESLEYQIGQTPTLFTNDIDELPVNADLEFVGSLDIRVTQAMTSEIAVDLIWPEGLLCQQDDGDLRPASVHVMIEFRLVGDLTWTNIVTLSPPPSFSDWNLTIYGDDIYIGGPQVRKPYVISVQWKTPAPATYEVRVTKRFNNYPGGDEIVWRGTKCQWTTLRSIKYTMPSTVVSTKIAMKVKATQEMTGNIQQLSCRVRQNIPVWTGSTWVTQFSKNPAWIYHWLLTTCPANSRRIAANRIAFQDIVDWAADCDTKGLTFSVVIDQTTTVGQLLADVCAAGRATFTVKDGKYSIVKDTLQTVPVQHFTPRNSWDFKGSRAFPDTIHALHCKFINPAANWQPDQMEVYDDGYDENNATKFESLELRGVTSAAAAWRLARYHLAVSRLRQNQYTWKADIEHLVCQRGDLVKVNHDVTNWGGGYGRIASHSIDGSGNTTALTLDTKIDLDPNAVNAIRIRTRTGASLTATISLSPTPYLWYVSPPIAGVNDGDLAMVGQVGHESASLIVTKITPSSDMTAEITGVDQALDIYNADAGTPPPFVSKITGQIYYEPPSPPQFIVVTTKFLADKPPVVEGEVDPNHPPEVTGGF